MIVGVPKTSCPFCGTELNAARQISDEPVSAPSPGDYAVCNRCEMISIIGPDHQLVRPTPAQEVQLLLDKPVDRVSSRQPRASTLLFWLAMGWITVALGNVLVDGPVMGSVLLFLASLACLVASREEAAKGD